ncbi:hypothetical protein PR048_009948 [Dryococelus australis]|uniref:Uncharacterized protein n=1 Tax=Dryococelus australis TaxID=614101 RepID=A0ABQ9I2A7_9NEOP|nr:hypothetical protein PR048_009948 [Dryococelus australis]
MSFDGFECSIDNCRICVHSISLIHGSAARGTLSLLSVGWVATLRHTGVTAVTGECVHFMVAYVQALVACLAAAGRLCSLPGGTTIIAGSTEEALRQERRKYTSVQTHTLPELTDLPPNSQRDKRTEDRPRTGWVANPRPLGYRSATLLLSYVGRPPTELHKPLTDYPCDNAYRKNRTARLLFPKEHLNKNLEFWNNVVWVLKAFECDVRRRSAGLQERGKREISEKIHRTAASSSTIPTCENPGATPPGILSSSLRWEVSSLTTTPPRPLCSLVRTNVRLATTNRSGLGSQLGWEFSEAEHFIASLGLREFSIHRRTATGHDKVSTLEINLRKKSSSLPAYILTDTVSDMRPVTLVTMDVLIRSDGVVGIITASHPEAPGAIFGAVFEVFPEWRWGGNWVGRPSLVRAALNSEVLRADDDEVRAEETGYPRENAPTSDTISRCENPGATPPGIEPLCSEKKGWRRNEPRPVARIHPSIHLGWFPKTMGKGKSGWPEWECHLTLHVLPNQSHDSQLCGRGSALIIESPRATTAQSSAPTLVDLIQSPDLIHKYSKAHPTTSTEPLVWSGQCTIPTTIVSPEHNRGIAPLTARHFLERKTPSRYFPSYGVNHYQHKSNQREPLGRTDRSVCTVDHFPWHKWVYHNTNSLYGTGGDLSTPISPPRGTRSGTHQRDVREAQHQDDDNLQDVDWLHSARALGMSPVTLPSLIRVRGARGRAVMTQAAEDVGQHALRSHATLKRRRHARLTSSRATASHRWYVHTLGHHVTPNSQAARPYPARLTLLVQRGVMVAQRIVQDVLQLVFTDCFKNVGLDEGPVRWSACLTNVASNDNTWTLNCQAKQKLRTAQRGMKRAMLGFTRRDRKRADYIRSVTKVRDIPERVKTLKWQWAGHTARRNRWDRDIRRVVRVNWKNIAQDRLAWKELETTYVALNCKV